MIIEYSNAKEPKNHARLSVVIVVASCAFFFIPTTLIILGYLASQPTGTLISPLPQGVISDVGAQRDAPVPTTPLLAAPSDSTASADANISPVAGSNITDKTASISAGLTQVTVTDPDIKSVSQIYLSPKPEDEAIYSVKSKSEGLMVIEVNTPSDVVRYVDYHLINP